MNCNENLSYVTGVILTYWMISISMVYLNKFLMTNNVISIPAPFFITWFQCLVTSVICSIAGYFGHRATLRNSINTTIMNSTAGGTGTTTAGYTKLTTLDLDSIIQQQQKHQQQSPFPQPSSFITQFPKTNYKLSTAIQIFPLSLIFIGMITFNNLCLTNVDVSFYNVARSLTIVFNIILSWIILGVTSSCKTISCLVIVIIGFVIGYQQLPTSSTSTSTSSTSTTHYYYGTYCGVLSSLFVSFNSIYTKKVLSIVDDNHWKLTFYNNVNGVFILLPIVYYYEFDYIMIEHVEQFNNGFYWVLMVIAGLLGFMIGIVTVLQIKATSPLCHNFSGTGKALVQSLLAFYVWKNEVTKDGVLSIVIVLGGSLLYTYVKMNECNGGGGGGGYLRMSLTGNSNGNGSLSASSANSSDVESLTLNEER